MPLLLVSNSASVTHRADATGRVIGRAPVAQERLKRDSVVITPARGVDSMQHLRAKWDSDFPYPVRALLRDSTNFRRVWALAVGGEPPSPPVPPIDFGHDMVIAAATGEQAGDWLHLVIDSATARNAVVHVYIRLAAEWCVEVLGIRNSIDMVKVPRATGLVWFHEEFHCTTVGPAGTRP